MKTTIRKDLVKILTKHNIPLRQIQAATYEKFSLSGKPIEIINLYPGHTDSEFDKWLSKMELIEYTGGYCYDFQSTIWLKGNIWITREEDKDGYYGWWEVHKRPPLPRETKSIKVNNPNQL